MTFKRRIYTKRASHHLRMTFLIELGTVPSMMPALYFERNLERRIKSLLGAVYCITHVLRH